MPLEKYAAVIAATVMTPITTATVSVLASCRPMNDKLTIEAIKPRNGPQLRVKALAISTVDRDLSSEGPGGLGCRVRASQLILWKLSRPDMCCGRCAALI